MKPREWYLPRHSPVFTLNLQGLKDSCPCGQAAGRPGQHGALVLDPTVICAGWGEVTASRHLEVHVSSRAPTLLRPHGDLFGIATLPHKHS